MIRREFLKTTTGAMLGSTALVQATPEPTTQWLRPLIHPEPIMMERNFKPIHPLGVGKLWLYNSIEKSHYARQCREIRFPEIMCAPPRVTPALSQVLCPTFRYDYIQLQCWVKDCWWKIVPGQRFNVYGAGTVDIYWSDRNIQERCKKLLRIEPSEVSLIHVRSATGMQVTVHNLDYIGALELFYWFYDAANDRGMGANNGQYIRY